MNINEIIHAIENAKLDSDYPRARMIALDGLQAYTDDYRLYEELADIYLFEGNIDKADEVLALARELHPESATGMYLEGYLATAKGEFDRAIEILSETNAHMPNNAEVLRNLGWAHVMQGNLTKGLSILRRAHNLAPLEPMIINDLSVALIAAGQEDEARIVLAKLGHADLIDTLAKSEN